MHFPLILLGIGCAYGHHLTQQETCSKEHAAQSAGQSNQGGSGEGGEVAQSPAAAPAPPRSGYNPFTVPLQAQSSPLFLEPPPMVQSSPQAGGGAALSAAAPVDEASEFGVVLTPIGGGSGGSEGGGAMSSAPSSDQGGVTSVHIPGHQSGGYRRFNRYMMQIF